MKDHRLFGKPMRQRHPCHRHPQERVGRQTTYSISVPAGVDDPVITSSISVPRGRPDPPTMWQAQLVVELMTLLAQPLAPPTMWPVRPLARATRSLAGSGRRSARSAGGLAERASGLDREHGAALVDSVEAEPAD